MITSNYVNNSSNLSSATRGAGASLENQQTSETGAQDANSWDLRSYLGDASQDVQNLKNGPESYDEPHFYQLSFCSGDGTNVYQIQAQVIKMADQDSYPLMGGLQKSRLYQTLIVSDELAKDYPELVGRPLVMDLAQGVDSRMGVQMCIRALLEDAKANKGTIGHEPRTGAQVSKDENGVQTSVTGGKDGIKIPQIKMPSGGFDFN